MEGRSSELHMITFAKDLCSYVMQASLKVFKFFLLCEALEQSAVKYAFLLCLAQKDKYYSCNRVQGMMFRQIMICGN